MPLPSCPPPPAASLATGESLLGARPLGGWRENVLEMDDGSDAEDAASVVSTAWKLVHGVETLSPPQQEQCLHLFVDRYLNARCADFCRLFLHEWRIKSKSKRGRASASFSCGDLPAATAAAQARARLNIKLPLLADPTLTGAKLHAIVWAYVLQDPAALDRLTVKVLQCLAAAYSIAPLPKGKKCLLAKHTVDLILTQTVEGATTHPTEAGMLRCRAVSEKNSASC